MGWRSPQLKPKECKWRFRNSVHDSDKNNTHRRTTKDKKKSGRVCVCVCTCVCVGDGELKDLPLPQADRLSGEGCWVMAQTALINTRLILPHDSP